MMNNLSRRAFLEEIAIVTAATSLPALSVAAGSPSSGSANERLRVAVIGVRGRGQSHVAAFSAKKDCEIAYVCDADRNVGEAYAEKLAAAKKGCRPAFVVDMRRIFDDKSIDIVSIATPNHWHSLAAIWAMQAGKDVYVEKPVSHNIVEGRRMVQASRKYHRICQAGTQHRSSAAAVAAAECFRQGKLGQLLSARCFTYRLRKPIGPAGAYEVPPGVDYNLWAGPGPLEKPVRRKSFHYDWHWFWAYGNGEIGNNGIHVFDTLRKVLDLKGLPRSVLCLGGRLQFNDAGETANTQLACYDFDGLPVIAEVRNFKTPAASPGAAFLVRGSEGLLAYNFDRAVLLDKQGKLIEKLAGVGEDHFANFLKAVRSRKREDQNADIEQGHVSTALCHLANISYRLGSKAEPAQIRHALGSLPGKDEALQLFTDQEAHLKQTGVDITKEQLVLGPKLTLDPARETFVDNPQADALLSREYRKPFVVPAENEL